MDKTWRPVNLPWLTQKMRLCLRNKYEVSNLSKIRNRITGRVLTTNGERVTITLNGSKISLRRHIVSLATFRPLEIPQNYSPSKFHCDHIDGNHSNNDVNNLQFLSASEHAKKTMHQTKEKRKSNGKARYKQIIITETRKDHEYNIGDMFESMTSFATSIGVGTGSVSQGIIKNYWIGDKYKVKFLSPKLQNGESFIESSSYFKSRFGSKYKVTNMGRVWINGVFTRGSRINMSKYRKVGLKCARSKKVKKIMVHRLVWMAKFGEIPKPLVVMHDDSIDTLDVEGCERNWVCDLSLGTLSDNQRSFVENTDRYRKVICIFTPLSSNRVNGKVFKNAVEAANVLSLNVHCIRRVCSGKRIHHKGFKFKYV
jgi:hypothetical protein